MEWMGQTMGMEEDRGGGQFMRKTRVKPTEGGEPGGRAGRGIFILPPRLF